MTAYEIALATANAASAKFHAIADDYRNMKIGDAEYLAARAEFQAANDAFDIAYAKAQEAAETGVTEDTMTQLSLL